MSDPAPPPRNLVYQVGTIRSLLGGVYEGDLGFDELAHYGDFGLGTVDAVNGEMIAIDGRFFRIAADGRAHPMEAGMKSPFAVVTRFRPEHTFPVAGTPDFAGLKAQLSSHFTSPNIIYALRIEGRFARLDARSEHPQPEGHQPLRETLSRVQTRLRFEPVVGTMVGFWFPQHMKAINVPGFHFHFLDASRGSGGHVFDLDVSEAEVALMPVFDFGMHLLHTALFAHADLTSESDQATREVEQAPAPPEPP